MVYLDLQGQVTGLLALAMLPLAFYRIELEFATGRPRAQCPGMQLSYYIPLGIWSELKFTLDKGE